VYLDVVVVEPEPDASALGRDLPRKIVGGTQVILESSRSRA